MRDRCKLTYITYMCALISIKLSLESYKEIIILVSYGLGKWVVGGQW